MNQILRIGTRESQLAVWQATTVKQMLAQHGVQSELVFIKSEGDINLTTPLYEMGVQGVFTKMLDIALLNNQIDIAVHSMKDVPIQLAKTIVQAAVLERASYKDLLVYNGVLEDMEASTYVVATSSIRRKAQWLHRYPQHTIENLRGNVNTRLKKLQEHNWGAAIFAAAGLERIGLRPENAIELDWMLPAPAQGAIMVVCREEDQMIQEQCKVLNHPATAVCIKAERDFLQVLMGGCSTPISALAQIEGDTIYFKGNIFSLDGKDKVEVERKVSIVSAEAIGKDAAMELLENGGRAIVAQINNESN